MENDFINDILDEDEVEELTEELAESFRDFINENCLKDSTWMFNQKRCNEISKVLGNLIAELKDEGNYISYRANMCDKILQDELIVTLLVRNFEPEYKFMKYLIDNVDGISFSSCNVPEQISIAIGFKNVRIRIK